MKENEKNTIKLFEYFYNHLYKTNFKLDLSINNQDKVLSNFVKELEKRVIGVSNNFLVSFLSFGFAYFYTKRLKRKITLNWIASKKLLTRFLAREEGTDYYTREFLREYNINLDELRSYLVEQQEVDYLALDKQEELNKARLPDSDARLYNCLQDTTLYNHRSAICLICHQKTFCKNLLKTTNNFVYKKRGYESK